MRQPAGAARHREYRHERVARQADRVEQQRGVDLDIGLERGPAWLQPGERSADRVLDLGGEGEARGPGTEALAETVERPPQHIAARIAEPEHAVAEAQQPLAGRELALGPGGDVAARRRLVEHVEGRAGRTAMQWPGEGAIGAERGRD